MESAYEKITSLPLCLIFAFGSFSEAVCAANFKGTDTNYAAKEFYLALSQWNKLMNATSFAKDIFESDWELGKRFSANGKIVDVIWNTEEHLSWRKNIERSSERTVTIVTDAVSVYDLYGHFIKSPAAALPTLPFA